MSERFDILSSAVNEANQILDSAKLGYFKSTLEVIRLASIWDILYNQTCLDSEEVSIELTNCADPIDFLDLYKFDVITTEDMVYKAGFYVFDNSRNTMPSTAAEIILDLNTTNSNNYFDIAGGLNTAILPGGVSINHTGSSQIACHVFIFSSSTLTGVKDVLGRPLTGDIVASFKNATLNQDQVDILVIKKFISPGSYQYSLY